MAKRAVKKPSKSELQEKLEFIERHRPSHGKRHAPSGKVYCGLCERWWPGEPEHDHASDYLYDPRSPAPVDRPFSAMDRQRLEGDAAKGTLDLLASNRFLDRLNRASSPATVEIETYTGSALEPLAHRLTWQRAEGDGAREGSPLWLLLNPTTSTGHLRRVAAYTRWYGYSSAWVTYLFSITNNDPWSLRTGLIGAPVYESSELDETIKALSAASPLRIFAWGMPGPQIGRRAAHVLAGPIESASAWALRFNSKDATPFAPHQIGVDSVLVPYPTHWAIKQLPKMVRYRG